MDQGTKGQWGTSPAAGPWGGEGQPEWEAVPDQGLPAEGKVVGRGVALTESCGPWLGTRLASASKRSHTPQPQGTRGLSCLTLKSCLCSLRVWGLSCGVRQLPQRSTSSLSLSPSQPAGRPALWRAGPGSGGSLGEGLQAVRTFLPRTQDGDLCEGLEVALQDSSSPERPRGPWGERGQGGHDLPPHCHPRRPVLTWGWALKRLDHLPFLPPAPPVLNVERPVGTFLLLWGGARGIFSARGVATRESPPLLGWWSLHQLPPGSCPGGGRLACQVVSLLLYNWPAWPPGLSTRTLPLHRMSVELCSD